ncbi:hypothetical protein PV518_17890 [Streptomyces sp. ND04-05B]|uniref:hypothetical protein n=1 Tax=Streptomyces sp. ND04-05B TaxID=3028693 RepID=UPI0029B6E6DD|nr:hypothetical protein [Streptomyces sp. ND04-05B]MDX3064033.1 hypothetical protein [Streptomyces sp. ND04-05B]
MAARKTTPPPAVQQEQTPASTEAPEPTAPADPPAQPEPEPTTPVEPAPPEDDQEPEEPRERTAVEAAYIAALQREREGYTRYGRKDRAAEVEAELDRLDAPFERAVPAPLETA